MEKKNDGLKVCVVGGGNSAHVLIPFLATAGHTVNLLTRRPNDWSDNIICDITTMDKVISKRFIGMCNISRDPTDVIPDADVIILCMPVHEYRNALCRVAPFINKSKKEVFVGTVYGQGGFNWMVNEIGKDYSLQNIVSFAIGLIPWICRTTEYGKHVENYGGKDLNVCAVDPAEKFDRLNALFLDDISWNPMGMGKFVQACSFLSLTLSVDNQIIHPSRCYGLWKKYDGGRWSSFEKVPYFYRDFDDCSAKILKNLDDDYSAVRDAVRKHFPDKPFNYMLSYLDLQRLTHRNKHTDIMSSFKYSGQLGLIKTPTIKADDGSYTLDTNCRFFTDDIPYGLLIAKWIAEKLNVQTPSIDEVIIWAQELRDEHWIDEEKGTIDMNFCMKSKHRTGLPPSYGLDSIDAILD